MEKKRLKLLHYDYIMKPKIEIQEFLLNRRTLSSDIHQFTPFLHYLKSEGFNSFFIVWRKKEITFSRISLTLGSLVNFLYSISLSKEDSFTPFAVFWFATRNFISNSTKKKRHYIKDLEVFITYQSDIKFYLLSFIHENHSLKIWK